MDSQNASFETIARQRKERELRDAFAQIADMVRAGDLTEEAANEWRCELEDRAARA